MGSGREYSAYQRRIINRYYDNIDTILLTRLGEITTDMALAGGDQKKLDRLWKRAEQALSKLTPPGGEPSAEVRRVLTTRDPALLASLVAKLSR